MSLFGSLGSLVPYPSPPVQQYSFGRRLEQRVPAHGHWRMQFYLPDESFVKFNLSVPLRSVVGIYGRGNARPTHTQYDFFHIADGLKEIQSRGARARRTLDVQSVVSSFVRYFDACGE